MTSELIDRIYECSFLPGQWPGVLDDLASLADARGAQLFAVREKVMNWVTSDSLTETFNAYVHDGWFARCDRRVCLFTRNQPSFLTEHDFWTQEQLDANVIYRDFFRPRGLGWSASTGMAMPTRDNIVFTVERSLERGPIERETVDVLNELRPHLARAALVSARLGLQNARGASDMLALLGLPALILDESGVVIEANTLMNDLQGHVAWRGQNRIALADPRANDLLWAALPVLGEPAASAAKSPVNSFALRGADGRAEQVGHLVPIKRAAHDIFNSSYALLIITPVTAGRAPPVELLRSLFDLTPSEARVARGLATGDSLDDIAESGGVSRNTVRSQLQQVMDKIGCSRQAEVAALLSNLAVVPGTTP